MQPDKWILKELKDLKDYILKYLRKHYIMLRKKISKKISNKHKYPSKYREY